MTRKEFIQKVLDHERNSIFTQESIVEIALQIFEDLGMSLPDHVADVRDETSELVLFHEWEFDDDL